MVTGRPTIYSDELAQEICDRISSGDTLEKICSEESMPCRFTVQHWQRNNQDFSNKLSDARKCRADARSDRIDRWCDEMRAGKLEPAAAKVVIDAEKWQAGRENSKRYGDKATVEHTGPDNKPIEIASTTNLPIEFVNAFNFLLKKAQESNSG